MRGAGVVGDIHADDVVGIVVHGAEPHAEVLAADVDVIVVQASAVDVFAQFDVDAGENLGAQVVLAQPDAVRQVILRVHRDRGDLADFFAGAVLVVDTLEVKEIIRFADRGFAEIAEDDGRVAEGDGFARGQAEAGAGLGQCKVNDLAQVLGHGQRKVIQFLRGGAYAPTGGRARERVHLRGQLAMRDSKQRHELTVRRCGLFVCHFRLFVRPFGLLILRFRLLVRCRGGGNCEGERRGLGCRFRFRGRFRRGSGFGRGCRFGRRNGGGCGEDDAGVSEQRFQRDGEPGVLRRAGKRVRRVAGGAVPDGDTVFRGRQRGNVLHRDVRQRDGYAQLGLAGGELQRYGQLLVFDKNDADVAGDLILRPVQEQLSVVIRDAGVRHPAALPGRLQAAGRGCAHGQAKERDEQPKHEPPARVDAGARR